MAERDSEYSVENTRNLDSPELGHQLRDRISFLAEMGTRIDQTAAEKTIPEYVDMASFALDDGRVLDITHHKVGDAGNGMPEYQVAINDRVQSGGYDVITRELLDMDILGVNFKAEVVGYFSPKSKYRKLIDPRGYSDYPTYPKEVRNIIERKRDGWPQDSEEGSKGGERAQQLIDLLGEVDVGKQIEPLANLGNKVPNEDNYDYEDDYNPY